MGLRDDDNLDISSFSPIWTEVLISHIKGGIFVKALELVRRYMLGEGTGWGGVRYF